ncbi:MAG TPA: hypothetical protein VHH09_04740 [Acidimicrobiales bacterium]|nr:hypothetical protein [Acidimicrobiales bacterium]
MLSRDRLFALAVGALAAVSLVACGDDEPDPLPPPIVYDTTVPSTTAPAAATYGAAFEGLCAARAAAPTDVNSARTTFYDRSHDPLHSLARDLEPVDRVLAARLLEAKEVVESDLRGEPPPPSLAGDLDRLREVTGQALARLSHPVPPCP